MPHINLLYPFIMDDPDGEAFFTASNILTPVLAEMAPFWIRFDVNCFRFFKHGKNCTLWLKPQSDTTLQSGEICVCSAIVVFEINFSFNFSPCLNLDFSFRFIVLILLRFEGMETVQVTPLRTPASSP